MTLLVAGLCLVLTLGLAQLTGSVAATVSERGRAQTAADAAALAAAAESAPGGGDDPAGAAARYATLNSARLVQCMCDPGATAMQVRVELGGVIADARAVLDPNAIAPLAVGVDRRGLDPRLADATQSLIAAGHGAITFVSGYRSRAEQERLWTDALAKYGSPEAADDWVAPPGTSMHERGLAVDLGGDLDLAVALVDRLHLPLWRPLANEPWHFELVGSRG